MTQLLDILRLKRVERNRQLVDSQYDDGIWKSDLERIQLAESLEDYLFPKDNSFLLRRIGDYRARNISNHEYLRKKGALLVKLLGDQSSIAELGCGSGWNLLALRFLGYSGELNGVDISPRGISVINTANQKWGTDIKASTFDLTKPGLSNVEPIRESETLFSFLALEQLPNDMEKVIQNLFNEFPNRKMIFIESSTELLPLHYSELFSILYVYKRDYQHTLKSQLRNLQATFAVERIRFSHRIGNEIAVFRVN